jgi:hypothetical protein
MRVSYRGELAIDEVMRHRPVIDIAPESLSLLVLK